MTLSREFIIPLLPSSSFTLDNFVFLEELIVS